MRNPLPGFTQLGGTMRVRLFPGAAALQGVRFCYLTVMSLKRASLAIAAAGTWITASEFLRNEILLRHYWVAHYAALGLGFATRPVNGALWMAWSFGLAALIARLSRMFSLAETIGYAWLAVFVLMWICLYNLQVLPVAMLVYAVPLSLLEVGVAAVLVRRIQG